MNAGEVARAAEAGSVAETKTQIAIGTDTANEMTETVIGTESDGNGIGTATVIGTAIATVGIETEIGTGTGRETEIGTGQGIGEIGGNGACPHAGIDAIEVAAVGEVEAVDLLGIV